MRARNAVPLALLLALSVVVQLAHAQPDMTPLAGYSDGSCNSTVSASGGVGVTCLSQNGSLPAGALYTLGTTHYQSYNVLNATDDVLLGGGWLFTTRPNMTVQPATGTTLPAEGINVTLCVGYYDKDWMGLLRLGNLPISLVSCQSKLGLAATYVYTILPNSVPFPTSIISVIPPQVLATRPNNVFDIRTIAWAVVLRNLTLASSGAPVNATINITYFPSGDSAAITPLVPRFITTLPPPPPSPPRPPSPPPPSPSPPPPPNGAGLTRASMWAAAQALAAAVATLLVWTLAA